MVSSTRKLSMKQLPVVLYIPNLMGYARIILAFIGLFFASLISQGEQQQHLKALLAWIVAALLDFADGIFARWLGQTSNYGVIIDLVADNILRTTMWISCILVASLKNHNHNHNTVVLISTFVICLEWCTMVAVLQSGSEKKQHWKEQRNTDPRIVQLFFRNNFRNPLGCLGIYGLFASPMALYISLLSHHPQPPRHQQFVVLIWKGVQCAAYIGRAICVPIEVYSICKFLSALAQNDKELSVVTNDNTSSTTNSETPSSKKVQ